MPTRPGPQDNTFGLALWGKAALAGCSMTSLACKSSMWEILLRYVDMRCAVASSAIALVPLLCAAQASYADAPTGIVIAMTGSSDPPLSVMGEIPANTAFQLKPDTQLTFLHYGSCKLVTVLGGSLTLATTDYQVGGEVESTADAPCPRTVTLAAAGEGGRNSGAFISRGLPLPPHWPVSPDIVFIGGHAQDVSSAAIVTGDGRTVLQLDLAGGRGRVPPRSPPLHANARYTLRLTLRDRAGPLEIVFIAAPRNGAAVPVVLHVE